MLSGKQSLWQVLLDVVTCTREEPKCRSQWSCSCKDGSDAGLAGIFSRLPWASIEDDGGSSDEDQASLEWKPTVLCADGSRYTGQWPAPPAPARAPTGAFARRSVGRFGGRNLCALQSNDDDRICVRVCACVRIL
ncbi:unnamed protein product [Effrenium voratum]|nr:unnamed protein product [Effrenium voratum]